MSLTSRVATLSAKTRDQLLAQDADQWRAMLTPPHVLARSTCEQLVAMLDEAPELMRGANLASSPVEFAALGQLAARRARPSVGITLSMARQRTILEILVEPTINPLVVWTAFTEMADLFILTLDLARRCVAGEDATAQRLLLPADERLSALTDDPALRGFLAQATDATVLRDTFNATLREAIALR